MSRNVVVAIALILVATQARAAPDAILASYRALTTAEPDCSQRAGTDEIIVCGRRDADRYRVPFIAYDAGDPRAETVTGERRRLQHITTPCQDRGPFLVGCGMVGVSIGVSGDGSVTRRRELAP